jgi:hypothetical protein
MLGWILINTGHSVRESFAKTGRVQQVYWSFASNRSTRVFRFLSSTRLLDGVVAGVCLPEDLALDNQITPIYCSNSSEWIIPSSFLCLYDTAFGIANSCIGEIAAATRGRNQLHPMFTNYIQESQQVLLPIFGQGTVQPSTATWLM